MALNHSLILKLKLSDATAKSTPDFSKLKDFFNIVATGQYSNTTIINAKSSTVTEWNLTLKAKKEGNVTIPAITVDTSSGKLSTKELTVKIVSAKPLSSIDKNSGIFVKGSVDNKKPYKFEPFFHTIKLYTKHDVKNVIFSPLELADVSVKPNGSYNIYPDKYKEESVNVIELSYVITPLNSGQITIPGTKITGVYTTHHGMGIASLFESIFESDQRSMTITNSEEFAIESKESQIEVLTPAANITPWLPAKSISLKEDMNKGDLMVGKPITRTITITANGLRGNQLPSIASDLIDSEDYKIYTEIPEITDKIEKKIITSSRKESYTIIPQKSGKITLPSVDVKWWNVKQSKLEHATLPAKTLQIMPGAIVDNVAAPKIQETDLDVPRQKIITEPDNFSLYFLLALLGVGGLFVIYRFTKLRPNIEWLSKYRTDITTKNKTENLNESPKQFRDLNSVSSVKELHEFLKYYAHCNLNLPPNSSLEIIFSTIKDNSSNIKEEHYRQLVRKLEGALYANQDCDIAEIRRECLHFLKLAKKDKKQKIKKNESKLPKLNPIHP